MSREPAQHRSHLQHRGSDAGETQQQVPLFVPTLDLPPLTVFDTVSEGDIRGQDRLSFAFDARPLSTSFPVAYPDTSTSADPIDLFARQYPLMSSFRKRTMESADSGVDLGAEDVNRYLHTASGSTDLRIPPYNDASIAPTWTQATKGQKRSRLPSKNVARKAPRKAAGDMDSSSRPTRSSLLSPIQDEGQYQRNVEQMEQSKDSVLDNHPLHLWSNGIGSRPAGTASTFRQYTSRSDGIDLERSISKQRRKIVDEEDEVQHSLPIVGSNPYSVETDYSPLAPTSPSRQRSELGANIEAQGPRLRRDYPVIKELAGVRTALGLANWNEYLSSMERLWIGEISGEEFAAETKVIFLMFDNATRRRMNNLMAMKVVVPMLEMKRMGKVSDN